MKVEIRLIGRLEEYWEKGKLLEIPDGASVTEVLAAISLPEDEAGMVALNGVSISRKNRASQTLTDGDSVTVIAPVHGG